MRAAVTGASGLVGGNLAAILHARGFAVRALRRRASKVAHLDDVPIEWIEGDLDDVDALSRCFDKADVVFHCAGVPAPTKHDGAHTSTNVRGTHRVLEAFRQASAGRLVHVSSVVCTGLANRGGPDVDEGTPWNYPEFGIKDVYAESKRAAEQAVLAAKDIDTVVVNPGYMIGPRDPKPSSGRLLVELAHRRVPGWSSGTNSFVDVRDVCRGMIGAFEKGRRGERYILGGWNLSYREAFVRICAVLGVKPPAFGFPDVLVKASGRIFDVAERLAGKELNLNSSVASYSVCEGYRFSSGKAERELGYTMAPLEDAVRDAAAWFRARGMIP